MTAMNTTSTKSKTTLWTSIKEAFVRARMADAERMLRPYRNNYRDRD